MKKANPVLLEPIMKVEVTMPEEYMGDVIGDINSLKDVLSNCVTTLIPDGLTVVAVVVIMIWKNPKLAFASMLAIPFMAAGMVYIQVKAHPRWQVFRKKSANLNAFIHEDMAGMRIIQSFHAQGETERTFDGLLEEHRQAFGHAVRMSDAFGSVIDFSWAIGCILLYFVGQATGIFEQIGNASSQSPGSSSDAERAVMPEFEGHELDEIKQSLNAVGLGCKTTFTESGAIRKKIK